MKFSYADNGLTIKAPGTDVLDFKLIASPLPTIVDPGSTDEDTVLDQVITTYTDASYYNDYGIARQIIVAPHAMVELPEPVSLHPSIATYADGLLTRVSNGLATVKLSTPFGSRGVVCDVTQYAPASTTTKVWAAGSLAKEMTDSILTRVAGKTSADMPLFTTLNYSGQTFVRNASFWGADLDLTAISVGNAASGPYRAGVAVTAKHVLFARHYPLAVGDVVLFVTAANLTVSRTVVAVSNLAGEHFTNDLGVASLNSDLPGTITPIKVPPANLVDYLPNLGPGVPIWGTNAVGELGSIRGLLLFENDILVFSSIAEDTSLWPFYSDYISGDSGSPQFAIIDDELVVLTCLTAGWNGQGTAVWEKLTELQALITAQDGGYTLSTVDLSSFTDYS